MSTKSKILLSVVVIAGSFAFGRYSAPVTIKTETKIVEVEKKVEDKKQNVSKDTHKKTTITVERQPTGASKEVTVIEEGTNYDKSTKSDTVDSKSNTSDTTKVVEKEKGHTTIFAMAGVDVKNTANGLAYGLGVNRTVFGPVTIGLWGLTNETVGCSVGLEF